MSPLKVREPRLGDTYKQITFRSAETEEPILINELESKNKRRLIEVERAIKHTVISFAKNAKQGEKGALDNLDRQLGQNSAEVSPIEP